MGFHSKEVYCYHEKVMTLQYRVIDAWMCGACWMTNDGTHPSEKLITEAEIREVRKEHRLKAKPKPAVRSEHQWTTCSRGRSIKARLYKKSRFTDAGGDV